MTDKAQASLEYMIMLALSLGVFAVMLYTVTLLITSSTSQIGVDSAYRAVLDVGKAADFIYIHGHPSKTRVEVYVPSNVEDISAGGKSVSIRLSSAGSYTDVYSVTRGNVSGDLSSMNREGYYVLSVESTPYGVINLTVT